MPIWVIILIVILILSVSLSIKWESKPDYPYQVDIWLEKDELGPAKWEEFARCKNSFRADKVAKGLYMQGNHVRILEPSIDSAEVVTYLPDNPEEVTSH